MDAKAPAAVTTFWRGYGAGGHLNAMAVACLVKTYCVPAAARAHLTPPSAV